MTDLPSPAGWTPSPEFRNVPVTVSRSCTTSSYVVTIALTSAWPPIIVFVAMAAGAVCRSFTRVDRRAGTTPKSFAPSSGELRSPGPALSAGSAWGGTWR